MTLKKFKTIIFIFEYFRKNSLEIFPPAPFLPYFDTQHFKCEEEKNTSQGFQGVTKTIFFNDTQKLFQVGFANRLF